MSRLPSPVVVVVVAALLAACACAPPVEPLPFEPAGPEAAPDPSKQGPFPVGVRTVDIVDDNRESPTHDGPRTLVTEIWYPAVEAAREGPFVSYDLYDALPDEAKVNFDTDTLGALDTFAVRDAAPRTDRGVFPTVIFSHGKGGIRLQSTFFTTFLASHGFVVIAPDHQGDTLAEIILTGDVDVTSTAAGIVDRPLDCNVLVHWLQTLPDDDPLKPILDTDTLGISGHSFGALTTMVEVGQDIRIDAAVAQAPVGVGAVNIASPIPVDEFDIPIALESSGEDQILPDLQHAQSLWDHLGVGPKYWMRLLRGGHFTYSDLCSLDVKAIVDAVQRGAGVDASNVLEDGCGEDNVPTTIAFPIIRKLGIGLFNQVLRHSDGSSKWLVPDEVVGDATDEATMQAEP